MLRAAANSWGLSPGDRAIARRIAVRRLKVANKNGKDAVIAAMLKCLLAMDQTDQRERMIELRREQGAVPQVQVNVFSQAEQLATKLRQPAIDGRAVVDGGEGTSAQHALPPPEAGQPPPAKIEQTTLPTEQ
jgi:hypothetical protein